MKSRLVLIAFPVLYAVCSAFAADNFQVEELNNGIWRIQAIQGTLSTVYAIEGEKEVLIIDACTGQEGLKEIVVKIAGNRKVKLALTHGHFDHSGGMKYFDNIYLHQADTGLLPRNVPVALHFIDEGYTFNLGGRIIEVLSIPGHTPGSVAFFDRKNKILFTGDGIGSTSVWAHISTDPLTTYLASVKRLEGMKDQVNELFVGHHEQEKIKLTTQYITDMRLAAEGVLDGTLESTEYINSYRNGRQVTYGSATLIFNPENLR